MPTGAADFKVSCAPT